MVLQGVVFLESISYLAYDTYGFIIEPRREKWGGDAGDAGMVLASHFTCPELCMR